MSLGIKKIQYPVIVSTYHYGVANIWPLMFSSGASKQTNFRIKIVLVAIYCDIITAIVPSWHGFVMSF